MLIASCSRQFFTQCNSQSGTLILENKPIIWREVRQRLLFHDFGHALVDNDICHHSGQHLLWTHEAHNILTTVMTNIVVDESTDNAEPLSIDKGKLANQFARLQEIVLKLTSRKWFSVVCTLIDNDIRQFVVDSLGCAS